MDCLPWDNCATNLCFLKIHAADEATGAWAEAALAARADEEAEAAPTARAAEEAATAPAAHTQCVVSNDTCDLSVRAESTRNSQIQAVLSRAPHHRMILLSYLSNEQIRSLRKALLRSLLLKYCTCTRLQHPFV